MSSPLDFLHSCSSIWAHSQLRVSQSALCSYCGSPGQVHTKHAGLHLIQINLFWFHMTKECAASIHQASVHVLWQSLILHICAVLRAVVYFLDVVRRGRLPALSEQSLKGQFPQIILVLSQKHLPLCFSMQGCINSELCVLLLIVLYGSY